MRLTIGIPTLNCEIQLQRCLELISNQSYKYFNIIICDGNSVDGTLNVARKFGCKIISNPRVLNHFAKGLIFNACNSEYLILIDSDNYLNDSDYLSKLISLMDSDPSILGVEPIFLESKVNKTLINSYLSKIGTDDPLALLLGYYNRFSCITNRWGHLPSEAKRFTLNHLVYWKYKFDIQESCALPIGANGALIRHSLIPKFFVENFKIQGFHHVVDSIRILNTTGAYWSSAEVAIEHDHCSNIGNMLYKKRRRWGRDRTENALNGFNINFSYILKVIFFTRGFGVKLYIYHVFLMIFSLFYFLYIRTLKSFGVKFN
jgi:glycosyltransferase involved in cell wall biosynthesis